MHLWWLHMLCTGKIQQCAARPLVLVRLWCRGRMLLKLVFRCWALLELAAVCALGCMDCIATRGSCEGTVGS